MSDATHPAPAAPSQADAPLAVIFDVDGVLVDSYQAHLQSWQIMAQEIGRTVTEEQFARTFGRVSREIIAELWGADAFSPEEIDAFDKRKETLYRELIHARFPAMPGAADLIQSLHAAGFKLAVGSSGPPENVALALDKLAITDLIDAVVTGADVTRGKPDPQVFLIASQKLGVPPERCAVIEDAPAGITAANAAGMTSIAFLSTGHTRDSIGHAALIVSSFQELNPERIATLIQQTRPVGPALPDGT